MASRPAPRTLEVIASQRVTPNMLRLTLGGPGLDGFPEGSAGGYVKLRLPQPGSDKPVVRTYTVRAQREAEIDVDFALHGSGAPGVATAWALGAKPGDTIEVGGPGPAKLLPPGRDFYLLAGDMTALPAISVNIEALPADARGLAVIEVQSEADIPALACPQGVEPVWLVNPEPGAQPGLLAERLRGVPWPEGAVYAWAASEFSAMRAMREYLRGERGLGPDTLYISSYWKAGETEDNHKVIKREDAEAAG